MATEFVDFKCKLDEFQCKNARIEKLHWNCVEMDLFWTNCSFNLVEWLTLTNTHTHSQLLIKLPAYDRMKWSSRCFRVVLWIWAVDFRSRSLNWSHLHSNLRCWTLKSIKVLELVGISIGLIDLESKIWLNWWTKNLIRINWFKNDAKSPMMPNRSYNK